MTFEPWWQDLRLAWVGLRRAKGFTGAAVLTLAIGMAGTTAMFALVEGVLLRPLPVREQDRLLVAWKKLGSTGATHWPFRAADIDVIGKESRVFESVAGLSYYGAWPLVAVENGSASDINGAAVAGDFFRVLGVDPILGRALHRADNVIGAENVLVITHRLWRRRYGGAPDLVGRRLMVSQRPFTIVGVMPPEVECPHGVEAWMTLATSASTLTNPGFQEGVRRDVDLIARLRPGATIEQARSELSGLTARLEAEAPPDTVRGWTPVVRSYEDVVVGDVPARPCSCCSARSGSCCSSRARTWRTSCSCAARPGGRSWRCARRSAPVAAGWRANCSPRACSWRSRRASSVSR